MQLQINELFSQSSYPFASGMLGTRAFYANYEEGQLSFYLSEDAADADRFGQLVCQVPFKRDPRMLTAAELTGFVRRSVAHWIASAELLRIQKAAAHQIQA